MLAPAWCAPVYARMQGVGRIFDSALRHGRVDWAQRRALARTLVRAAATRRRSSCPTRGNRRSCRGSRASRCAPATSARCAGESSTIGDGWTAARCRAWSSATRRWRRTQAQHRRRATAPVLVPDRANRDAAIRALDLRVDGGIAILCPGAEFGPAKRWPPEHFADLARKFLADGLEVWLLGSPNDKPATEAVLSAAGTDRGAIRDLSGRTDLGTAIDLLSLASIVVSNDSGLMHAAAAVGAPLVALFGSSSPAYTPPMSATARIARIDIACSPCFKRECPLGHFKCMHDLAPPAVYDLARAALRPRDPVAEARPAP